MLLLLAHRGVERIERGERPDQPDENRHRVRVATKAVEKKRHLLMHHRVVHDAASEFPHLLRVRQFPFEQQRRHLQEVAPRGEFLDRIASVCKAPRFTVDETHGASACGRTLKTRIVGREVLGFVERRRVDGGSTLGAANHIETNGGATVVQRQNGLGRKGRGGNFG